MNYSLIQVKNILSDIISTAVTSIFNVSELIQVDRISDVSKGDFACNIALILAKKVGKSPLEVAVSLVDAMNHALSANKYIKKIEIAGPGFINFFLVDDYFINHIDNAVKNKSTNTSGDTTVGAEEVKVEKHPQYPYGSIALNFGKKIAYEYTDPNPFKVFHIGHLMANMVGESLSRLGEYTQAEIKRFCYQGDLGRHVALFIYGLRLMDKPFPSAKEGEEMPLVERMYYMGTAYAKGATYFKNHPEIEADVQIINKKLYDKSDDEINTIYDLGLEWSLSYFETLYQKLGTKFDQYFFESKCVEPARNLIAQGLEKGIFSKSDGAIVFEGEKFSDESQKEKLHTRVFITKYDLPTYDAKELGLAKLKYDAFQYDKSIVVTANEQDQYFKVNLKVQSLVLPQIASKNNHVSHGMMILPTGKMSSRTGDVVSAEEMLESAQTYVFGIMKDREMTDPEKQAIATQIAISGLKYLVLRQATGKDVIYDDKKALSFDGDSGPYLQYTCVRARTVVAKAKEQGIDVLTAIEEKDILPLFEIKEIHSLIKKISMFEDSVLRAYNDSAPHFVATYLIELSASFNAYYANHKIIDTSDEVSRIKSAELVTITQAVSNVIANGLYILGIEVPPKM